MIKKSVTILASLAVAAFCTYAAKDMPTPITDNRSLDVDVLLDCDTILNVDGYSVHIIRDNGKDVFTGLNLFSKEMRESADDALLKRIESDLYMIVFGKSDANDLITRIIKGKVSDFKSITPQTSCSVTTSNAKNMIVEWSADGRKICVTVPISYETANGGNRTATENSLIARIKKSDGSRKSFQIEKNDLESYSEELFVLPGAAYQNKNVTRNVYLDSGLTPVWDTKYPGESMANLFIMPSENYDDVLMDVTVLKHEYGSKESFEISVSKLLSEIEKDGCVSYWGVEGLKNGILEGALFLFNPTQGYDHVLKIECNPDEVISGTGKIKARASLYIPTNNVDNLNAPYEKKSHKEKIRYEK